MALGIALSGVNHIHFGDMLGFFFEFIPQMIFLLATFGYMDFMIIYKMAIDWTKSDQQAPNLITTLMDMFLKIGGVKDGFQLFSGQARHARHTHTSLGVHSGNMNTPHSNHTQTPH